MARPKTIVEFTAAAMLTQIVRPMVRTQIRLLANSHATRTTLIETIAHWLGFLGVRAHVTQLDANSGEIRVSLTVGKPESCDGSDWQCILDKLNSETNSPASQTAHFTPQQTRQLQRLLAYVVRAGYPDQNVNWAEVQPHLQVLGFDEMMQRGIQSAAKIPQSLDVLMDDLDSDVAAVALPMAVSIALLDRQVNSSEDQALAALFDAMKQPVA